MFDGSRKFDDEDRKIVEIIKEKRFNKEIFVIINKVDLPIIFDLGEVCGFEYSGAYHLSHKNGIDEILNELKSFMDKYSADFDHILVSKWQINSVENALKALDSSFLNIERGELELFALDIREAIENIASISTPFEYSELLDSMFSNFCLGK
jgi:tRNA modification GTPase